MHPVLFELGSLKVYSYGVLIACGAIAGVWYMYKRGNRELGLTLDQANNLFSSFSWLHLSEENSFFSWRIRLAMRERGASC